MRRVNMERVRTAKPSNLSSQKKTHTQVKNQNRFVEFFFVRLITLMGLLVSQSFVHFAFGSVTMSKIKSLIHFFVCLIFMETKVLMMTTSCGKPTISNGFSFQSFR